MRGGSRAAAMTKGFLRDGWTAFYSKESRRWQIWDPDMSFYTHLGTAMTAYQGGVTSGGGDVASVDDKGGVTIVT